MCFMAEMDCVYSYILKQLTAIEPVKSSSLYFEFVLTTIHLFSLVFYQYLMDYYNSASILGFKPTLRSFYITKHIIKSAWVPFLKKMRLFIFQHLVKAAICCCHCIQISMIPQVSLIEKNMFGQWSSYCNHTSFWNQSLCI